MTVGKTTEDTGTLGLAIRVDGAGALTDVTSDLTVLALSATLAVAAIAFGGPRAVARWTLHLETRRLGWGGERIGRIGES